MVSPVQTQLLSDVVMCLYDIFNGPIDQQSICSCTLAEVAVTSAALVAP